MHRTIHTVPAALAGAALLFAATACNGDGGTTVQMPDDPVGTVETVVQHVAQNEPEAEPLIPIMRVC